MSSPPSAGSVVVADAGPLIALGRLDRLGLLIDLFAQVQVPRAAIAECMAKPERDDAVRISAAISGGLLVPCDARPIEAAGLDIGECAAIGRALEIRAGLLADDLAARHHAQSLGISVIGTLGLLVLAKDRGLIDEVGSSIDRLRAGGQRLSRSAVEAALRAAGEARGSDPG